MGFTDDLPRRSEEHERNYRKIFKVDHIELMIFSVIDPKYMSDAETSLKDYFKTNKVDYANTKELITLDKSEFDKAVKHYTLIKNSQEASSFCSSSGLSPAGVYIGCYMEMHMGVNIDA